MGKINQYILFFRIIQKKPWVKNLLYVWFFISSYDSILSQLIPEKISKKAPKVWEISVMTGHLLPFWGWLLILAGILIVASFEYGIRKTQQQSEKQTIVPTIGKYLSGNELLQRWNIKDFQLLDCINKGLTPYNQQLVPIPIKILNHQSLPDGFLNSINKLPDDEELMGQDLKTLQYYAYTIFKENHFSDTKEILQHLPKYFIKKMLVQMKLAFKKSSSREETRKLIELLSDDLTITIDLRNAEQLKQLNGLIFKKEDIESKENENKLGYSDFIRLFNVNDVNDWEDNFKIKNDGVYKELKEDVGIYATKGELAALSDHHLKDLSKPCLSFPFSLEELNKFIEYYGMTGYVDQFYLENLKNKDLKTPIWKAIQHIAQQIREEKDGNYFLKSRDILRQKAIDGLRIFGKKQLANSKIEPHWRFDSCLIEIPKDYWKEHELSGASVIKQPNSNIPYTFPIKSSQLEPKAWENSYADLHVNCKDIKN